ncbi:hypothetical protein Tco_0248169, partial [Tanacetum coccineum]
MASMNTRLNIEKLDENIVQKHGGLKQVGFKQLGPGVETGVQEVHDEKRVWFEVKLQGAQGDHEAEVFQVSNDETAVAQRWLKDKQPEEKTNTDCLVKEQEKEYQTGWKITRGNVLDSCNQRSTQQCMKSEVAKHLGVAGIQQQNRLVDETNVTLFAKIYAHESLTFNNTVACEVISKWKVRLKDDMDARSDVYVLSNGCRKCSDDSDGYYWEYTPGMFIQLFLYIDDMVFSCGCKAEICATKGLLDKAKGNVLGMEIAKDHSGNTLRVSQSRFYNGKLVQTLLEGHSILSLEGSLSGDCDVEKNGDCDVEKNGKWSCIYAVGSQEYQMVCTRLDIASANVGMLDKFDHGLQTDVQVFVDFDYAMGRSITVMGRSITGYMTFTEARKKEIWLKGLLTKSGYELRLVAGIATGALVKGCSLSEVPAQVKVASYR